MAKGTPEQIRLQNKRWRLKHPDYHRKHKEMVRRKNGAKPMLPETPRGVITGTERLLRRLERWKIACHLAYLPAIYVSYTPELTIQVG